MDKKVQASQKKKNDEAENLIKSHFKDEKKLLTLYNQNLQLADFSDLTIAKNLEFFTNAGISSLGYNIIFLFGYKIPSDKRSIEICELFFISKMDDIINNKYILVFLNNGVSFHETKQVKFLKALFERLPSKYFSTLINIYVVSPTLVFKSKLTLSFGFITSFLKLKLVYLDDIDNLEEQMFFRSEFYQRIPDFILQHSSKKADFSIRLKSETSNDLNNLGLGSDRKKLIGRELKDFALSESGIPYAIIALTAYFDLEAINTEGIFRKPAAFSEEIRLEEYLESQNYNNIFSIKNPIVVGGVFKKIFTKLPEPLFPYAVYEKLKDFNNIDERDRIEFLRSIVILLPEINKNVLFFLLKFFEKIIENQLKNKMNSYNLAVCFSPCLLKPQNYAIDDLLTNTAIMVGALKMIIEKNEEIFADIIEKKKISSDLNLLKSKTFLIEEWKNAEDVKNNEIMTKNFNTFPRKNK